MEYNKDIKLPDSLSLQPGDGIYNAEIADLDEITNLEAACFPEAEAATRNSFEWRIKSYSNHFLLLKIGGKIVSFVNGPVTKEADLIDEMYTDKSFCDDNGHWQMIYGVATHPDYQKKGCAGYLMEHFIQMAKSEGRKGVVLTCKEAKIHFYAKFGFKDEGLSTSTHGGVPWHQMRITF